MLFKSLVSILFTFEKQILYYLDTFFILKVKNVSS